MNKKILTILGAAMALVAVSCQRDSATIAVGDEMRTVEVYAAQTRTTIGYEASDVSHLEWCEGDRVAYVTDVAGDTFKSAEMKYSAKGWYFSSNVTAAAETIYVIYPVGDNVGKSLAEAKASLAAEFQQVADADFVGENLPMYASAPITSTSRVEVVYEVMASVVRFSVVGEGHDIESLQSVTLTTNEPLVGDYSYDAASGKMLFEGAANSIKVDYVSATELGEDVLLARTHDIYMVVPSATFTGVDVVVKTDADTYVWSNGAMDLSHPERRLYRVALDLAAADGAPAPVNRYFSPVCSLDEITDEGTYLIATNIDGKYYVTNNEPTDTANYYYVEGVELPSDEFGVLHSEDAMNYTWSITKHDQGYMLYSANMVKQGSKGVYLISQGGSDMFSGEGGYEGKAWYVLPSALPTGDLASRAYWDITVDGNGTAVLYNKYDRGVDMRVCYKYCTAHNYFALCFEGAPDKADIAILKLADAE
ncbi:MAG: hypothetical protein IIX38_01995 [Alistipes sp.]|nr:hypothetical protein [Alistipes sp.]